MLKLFKNQNPTLGEELDPGLSRYCENIISQSFNLPDQLKPKNLAASLATSRGGALDKAQNYSESKTDVKVKSLHGEKSMKSFAGNEQLHGESMANAFINSINDVEPQMKKSESTTMYRMLPEEKEIIGKTAENLIQNDLKEEMKEEKEELITKGISPEQVQLLHLLRKRKAALLAWLLNSKETDVNPNDVHDNQYLNVNQIFSNFTRHPLFSGT